METTKTLTLVGIVAALAVVAVILLSISNWAQGNQATTINNFDECIAAGYPIMESYPEQCAVPGGPSFTNPRQNIDEGGITFNGCAVAGCSGQLCVSADEAGGIITTCEYRAEYACYKEASCEPQADGKCGWSQTSELQRCLANPPALDASAEVIY